VSIVTATAGRPHACTTKAFTCPSLEPPLVLVCLGRDSTTRLQPLESRAFVVNVLPASADHTIFVGGVVAAETGASEPIVFYRGRFTSLAPLK